MIFEIFNFRISRLQENGIYEYEQQKLVAFEDEHRKNDFGITQMELFELNVIKTKGVFILLLLGLFISLIVFLLEILLNFFNEIKALKVLKGTKMRNKIPKMDTIYKVPKKVRPQTR